MSEQIVDLRSAWAILRRHRRALVVIAVLGALAGGAVAYVFPGSFSSTSVVLLPAVPNDAAAQVTSHDVDTQVQIALSDVVLGRAGKSMDPSLSADQVAERVDVVAPTSDVLRFTATGATRAQAKALASAVATADVEYLREIASSLSEDQRAALSRRSATLKKSQTALSEEIKKTRARLQDEDSTSQAGRADASALADLTAKHADIVLQIDQIEQETSTGSQPLNGQPGSGVSVIQKASPAERMPFALRTALFSGLGLAAALLVTATSVVWGGRKERTLRYRDQIADAVGIPVVASVQSQSPRGVARWGDLLRGYSPADIDRWALRQLLRLVTPGTRESLARAKEDGTGDSTKVVVITLSDDSQALAVGPQFASFVASLGLTTQLVLAQQHEAADALWAAGARIPEHLEARPALSVYNRQDRRYTGDVVVYLAVLDRRRPELYLHGADGAVTLLALTAGSATAEDLARVAVAADETGHSLDGLVVANPDPLDRTTGRLLSNERAQQVSLPSLMTGSAAAAEAATPATHRRPR